ncbi:hypothetical protein [Stutzerimonas stutzeri]|uniref:hypothetical protein n=1 Tax=Stutzerimonas stutzeri TaxID=316 RepID=UPI00148140DE|nr:hypothetical protein [Stutzerimonas stutzeri]WRQ02327.1 hypothetical protein U3Q39_017500 [Stutzerimonas stutzeri]
MHLRPLLSAALALCLITPALAEQDLRRIRITTYEMASHLLTYNNPNLKSSLSNHGEYRSAYSEKLNELELMTMRLADPRLSLHFTDIQRRISALETFGSADCDRLASWINPILEAHAELDMTAAAAEEEKADGQSLVSDILLRIAQINFYYQLRTFSTLSVPPLRDVTDPIATLDTEILDSFAEAERRFSACSAALVSSLKDYRFVRPGLLDNRSAWIHESVNRYTSSISSKLSPMLTGTCHSTKSVSAR